MRRSHIITPLSVTRLYVFSMCCGSISVVIYISVRGVIGV